MSKKLQCKVSQELGAWITRLQIEVGGKGKALERMVGAALAAKMEFPGGDPFGADEKVNCTLTVSEAFYNQTTLAYRQKYTSTTATAFFKQALQHGALAIDAEIA